MEEARDQINRHGYAGMTIRSVAKACNIGVGTVYNYFKSKEILIHAIMYEDWLKSIEIIENCGNGDPLPEEILRCIYDEISAYSQRHKILMSDPHAATVFAIAYGEGHKYIRNQLAKCLKDTCDKYAIEPTELLPDFVAGTTLVWCSDGKSFEKIYAVLKHLFK